MRTAATCLILGFPLTRYHLLFGPLLALVALLCGTTMMGRNRPAARLITQLAAAEILFNALLLGFSLIVAHWGFYDHG